MKELFNIFIFSVVIAFLFVIAMGGLSMVNPDHAQTPAVSNTTNTGTTTLVAREHTVLPAK